MKDPIIVPQVLQPHTLAGQDPLRIVGDVESLLRTFIEGLEPEPPTAPGRGRPRVLPSLLLWAGLLVCVMRGFGAQRDLWRLLGHYGLWDYPRYALSDQAIYKRLAQAGWAPLETLFYQLSALLATRLTAAGLAARTGELAPFARGVYVLDESTLAQVVPRLDQQRALAKGDDALLAGKLAARFDVRRQQWDEVRYRPAAKSNEKLLAAELVAPLEAGSLVMFDLGYFGFEFLDRLTAAKLHFVTRLRGKTSLNRLHTFYQDGQVSDQLVQLGIYRTDRAAYTLRLVTLQRGTSQHAYLTNVLDPAVLSVEEVVTLYARRWDIEMAFQLVKQHLGLNHLVGSKETVVVQQVWAVLSIAQILHALQWEVALRAGVGLEEVSLALLVRHLPQWARAGEDGVARIVADGVQFGFIRPSRRLTYEVPPVPIEAYQPPPETLPLWRQPRYARRKCGPRSTKAAI